MKVVVQFPKLDEMYKAIQDRAQGSFFAGCYITSEPSERADAKAFCRVEISVRVVVSGEYIFSYTVVVGSFFAFNSDTTESIQAKKKLFTEQAMKLIHIAEGLSGDKFINATMSIGAEKTLYGEPFLANPQ